jgi:predicted SprT family Zn-dependent metalloprotease
MCETGKSAYLSKVDAQLAVLRILLRDQKVNSKPTRVYRCEFCQHWHLTSRTHTDQPRIA